MGTQAAHNGVERLTNLTTGGPVHVDVRDGRILRIVPLQLDESDGPSWTIGARGRTYSPPRKTTLSPWTVAHRSTIYSSQRILTPLKRVDFDPHGDRNIQTRGESGYEPITWDEALDIVAGEITRIKREVGPAAMMSTAGSHHLWGNIGYRFSAYNRFMNLVGFTYGEHNPDSWEGWHWGGVHMWGFSHRLGIPEQYDLLEDALKHTEMMVFWSADPETTGGVYGSFESTSRRFWLKELGVKMVFIDPYHNHTAGLFAGKWLAPRPGTDVALGLAIAFTWLAESTYDKEYVAGRTHGFDDWKRYVLGESDGLPKTPDWAERESGVPAREIRALAREWAAKKTMLSSGGMGGWGGACRAATGNEWARMMIALAVMQGMGKPGSNIWSTTSGVPFDTSFFFPGYAEGGISGDFVNTAAGRKLLGRMWPDGGAFSNPQHSPEGQTVPRLRIPEAMRHERLEWRGKGFCGSSIEFASVFQKPKIRFVLIIVPIVFVLSTIITFATGVQSFILTYLPWVAATMTAVGGVIIADYWLVAKGKYPHVDTLTERVNWVGMTAFICGTAVNMITYGLSNGHDYGFRYGIPGVNGLLVAAVLHWAVSSVRENRYAESPVAIKPVVGEVE